MFVYCYLINISTCAFILTIYDFRINYFCIYMEIVSTPFKRYRFLVEIFFSSLIFRKFYVILAGHLIFMVNKEKLIEISKISFFLNEIRM